MMKRSMCAALALVWCSGLALAASVNLTPGGHFENLSGPLPIINFGDTPPAWGWHDYGNGGACAIASDQSHGGDLSVKWVTPQGWSGGSGHEFYYQNSVASVPQDTYIFSGWIRQENKASNYVPGLNGAGGLTCAIQFNDGGGYNSALVDCGEVGYGAADAPTWELFANMFVLGTSGPFNGGGTYFALGFWRNNPTSTASAPINTWLDDLLASPRAVDGDNLCPGGDFEALSGNLPVINFGDTPAQWGWHDYGNGGTCAIATDQAHGGSKSAKWVTPQGWSSGSGHEFYYQNSVASVEMDEYIFSGWIRQQNKASNYVPGLNGAGGLTCAIQFNDGGGYNSALLDCGETGYGASDAPTWEPFANPFELTTSGPFNGSGQYFALGFWRNSPTSTASNPINTWLDDLECKPRATDLVPVELSNLEIE